MKIQSHTHLRWQDGSLRLLSKVKSDKTNPKLKNTTTTKREEGAGDKKANNLQNDLVHVNMCIDVRLRERESGGWGVGLKHVLFRLFYKRIQASFTDLQAVTHSPTSNMT